jgi:hypothetical protein
LTVNARTTPFVMRDDEESALMKLVVPDLISNSYFPVIAAADLGFFEREGLDLTVELLFPVSDAYRALAAGTVDFVGGSAHSGLAAFPHMRGMKLLAAQAQGMYWFLVMRSDIGAQRGAIECVKGCTIGAAPWVEMGLRVLLAQAGLDLERDGVKIVPVPGSQGAGVNFGVTAARALEERRIDGFWANGMARCATRGGHGRARRAPRRRPFRLLRLHFQRAGDERPGPECDPRSRGSGSQGSGSHSGCPQS